MKVSNFIVFSFVFSLFFNCKTVDLRDTSQKSTTQHVFLGSISSGKGFLLQKEVSFSAIPHYKSPLRLMVTPKIFNNQAFNLFTKAKAVQPYNVNLTYVDSLPNKPKYLKIQIADHVGLVKALNSEENSAIKTYLLNNKEANILTEIAIAFNTEDIEAILNADAVFLRDKGNKVKVLQLYTNSNKTKELHFNKGVIFKYNTMYCCWKQNNTHTTEIVDLVSTYSTCPNNTYRSASKAEKKRNHFKF